MTGEAEIARISFASMSIDRKGLIFAENGSSGAVQ